jgi:hypothetical protein
MLFGAFEPCFDQIDVVPRCCDALLRLLLERVEYINDARELDGIDGAIGVSVEVVDDFQRAPPTEALQYFGGGAFDTTLSIVFRLTENAAHLLRK